MSQTGSGIPGILVADVAWPEIQERLNRGAIAILPVGAACKEHGPHLPMNTDWLQAEWLCDRLVRRFGVVVWPTLGYGHYPAFVDFPGSVSLSSETFLGLAGGILDAIARAGARQCLIVNTGISTIPALRTAVAERPDPRPVLINVYDGPAFRSAARDLEQQPRGGHADELETSIMLYMHPGRTDLSRAESWAHRELSGPFSRTDSGSPGFSPAGVYGDPTRATAEKGRVLTDAMLSDIEHVIREVALG